ncbi:MAG: DUF2470 domain-containing protein [Phormidesmis sp.]
MKHNQKNSPSSHEPSKREGAPLTDKLLTAISRHLNQDHQEDLLACAKTAADVNWAKQASLTQLKSTGMTINVRGANQVQSVQIDFIESPKGVLALRRLLAKMIHESRAQLGWPSSIDDD